MAKPSKPAAKGAPKPTQSVRRGHGSHTRGLDVVARSPEGFGRFGRMFPELPPARYGATLADDIKVMHAVADTMIKIDAGAPIHEPEPVDESPTIAAGYTYFGQFVDHDITFDVASSLDRATDPGAIEDFRTPRLDLDSVYGRGPDDQPYMYNPDLTMRLGPNRAPGGKPYRPDVFRAPAGAADEGTSLSGELDTARALLGDKRNDENSIVVQIHALFIRLHNTFMRIESDAWQADNPGATNTPWERIFRTAQRRTRWTYQYLVIHDFVRRLVGDAAFHAIWRAGHPDLRYYTPDDARFPYMPVEFSVAAYRLGHSMVRPSYALNETSPDTRVPVFGPSAHDSLNGFRPLPANFGIDWGYFFGDVTEKGEGALQIPQPSYRIDTLLVGPLQNLPDKQGEPDVNKRSLPALNLRRGVTLGLPSGQAVARRMGYEPLTDDELWREPGNLPPATDEENKSIRMKRAALLNTHRGLRGNAPLWYYILREAELTDQANVQVEGETQSLGGGRLGAVGARIIAEVFMGLLQKDEQSFLVRHRRWQPAGLDGKPMTQFSMATLAQFVDAPPKVALEPN